MCCRPSTWEFMLSSACILNSIIETHQPLLQGVFLKVLKEMTLFRYLLSIWSRLRVKLLNSNKIFNITARIECPRQVPRVQLLTVPQSRISRCVCWSVVNNFMPQITLQEPHCPYIFNSNYTNVSSKQVEFKAKILYIFVHAFSCYMSHGNAMAVCIPMLTCTSRSLLPWIYCYYKSFKYA